MKQNSAPANNRNVNSTSKILIVGLVVILIVIVAVGIMLFNVLKADNVNAGTEPPEKSNSYVLDESNLGEVVSQIDADIESGQFMINMNMNWRFTDSKSASYNAYIANSSNNTNPVVFDVSLEDSGELVYTSTIIPIGKSLKSITLDKELSAGTYPAICTYRLLDDNGEVDSTLSVAVTIYVEG